MEKELQDLFDEFADQFWLSTRETELIERAYEFGKEVAKQQIIKMIKKNVKTLLKNTFTIKDILV